MKIEEWFIAYVLESSHPFTGITEGHFIKVYHCVRPSQYTSFHYYFTESRNGKIEDITKEKFEELIGNTFKKTQQ